MQSIGRYDGGKGADGVFQAIINKIPPHQVYVSLFAGHDAIYRHIRRAPLSIINDIDPKVIATWKRYKQPDCQVVEDFMQGELFERTTMPVTILRNNDYKKILPRFQHNPYAFIYLDPPYPFCTRSYQLPLYNFEFSDNDHLELLKKIKQCSAQIMLSSYRNNMYDQELKGWYTHTFTGQTRRGTREEIIYMNYPPPAILHDTQYIGNNYRERLDIKRKVKRMRDKLARLPEHHRIALLSSIINEYKQETEKIIRL